MYLSWAHCRPNAFTSSGVWSFWLATVQTFSLRTAAVRLPVTWLLHAVIIRCWRKHLSKWNQLPKFHSETIFSLLWSVSLRSLPLFFSQHESSQTWPARLPCSLRRTWCFQVGPRQRPTKRKLPTKRWVDGHPSIVTNTCTRKSHLRRRRSFTLAWGPKTCRRQKISFWWSNLSYLSSTSSSSYFMVKYPTHSYTHHQYYQSHPHQWKGRWWRYDESSYRHYRPFPPPPDKTSRWRLRTCCTPLSSQRRPCSGTASGRARSKHIIFLLSQWGSVCIESKSLRRSILFPTLMSLVFSKLTLINISSPRHVVKSF